MGQKDFGPENHDICEGGFQDHRFKANRHVPGRDRKVGHKSRSGDHGSPGEKIGIGHGVLPHEQYGNNNGADEPESSGNPKEHALRGWMNPNMQKKAANRYKEKSQDELTNFSGKHGGEHDSRLI
jgi:hypothetical protein